MIWQEQVRNLERSDRTWDQLRTRARILVFATIGFAGVFFTKTKSPINGTTEISLSAVVGTLLVLSVIALMIIERPQFLGSNEVDWSIYSNLQGDYKKLSRDDLNRMTISCRNARNNYDTYQKPFFKLYYAMMCSSFATVLIIAFVGMHS